jgi:hypothetical protein
MLSVVGPWRAAEFVGSRRSIFPESENRSATSLKASKQPAARALPDKVSVIRKATFNRTDRNRRELVAFLFQVSHVLDHQQLRPLFLQLILNECCKIVTRFHLPAPCHDTSFRNRGPGQA